jgi:hypothetical protein
LANERTDLATEDMLSYQVQGEQPRLMVTLTTLVHSMQAHTSGIEVVAWRKLAAAQLFLGRALIHVSIRSFLMLACGSVGLAT